MKLCKICNQVKPFDATQKYGSKRSGFMGNICWDCVKARARLAVGVLTQEDLDFDAKHQAIKQQQTSRLKQAKYQASVAHIEAQHQAREAKYVAWVAEQRVKNQRKLAKQLKTNSPD